MTDFQIIKQPINFTPGVTFDDVSMTLHGLRGMSARITADTRCNGCGKPIRRSDRLIADLAADPDDAVIWHERCKR